MTVARLKEVRCLIDKEKKAAKNPKKMLYSQIAREKITNLTKTLSTSKISEGVGVSRSFVEKLRKGAGVSKEILPPIELLDLTKSFMKEAHPNDAIPIMRFSTSKGLTIEIFD